MNGRSFKREVIHDNSLSISNDSWLSSIVRDSNDAIISKNLSGIITSWNNSASSIFGYLPHEAIGKSIKIIIPEDKLHEEESILDTIKRNKKVESFETVRLTKYGHLIDLSVTVSPITNRNGAVVGASKIARDISEFKAAREKQDLIIREMHHRIKNLFTVAMSLVSISSRSATDVDQLKDDLNTRLLSLQNAHQLTLPEIGADRIEQKDTSLFPLLQAILHPYGGSLGAKVTLSGADHKLRGRSLTPLALLLNELATNSLKYGALSLPDGMLKIISSVRGNNLHVDWEESGAFARSNGQEGFGSRLETATIRSMGGNLSRNWTTDGLSIAISLPLDTLSD